MIMKNGNKNKNGTKPAEKSNEKNIPIIQTLKPKKRYTKIEKELIKATNEAMEAIIRFQEKEKNAKV